LLMIKSQTERKRKLETLGYGFNAVS
jgi:hypothetical protein